ncbi:putative quinol monooxygenase [Paraglaciecola aestuariivivens]
MSISRREFISWLGAAVLLPISKDVQSQPRGKVMYGLIGKIISSDRDKLSAILIEGVAGMPGCLSYIVANDKVEEDALWITEVWESAQKHKDALSLPSVEEAIEQGRPLIKRFAERIETQPLGGQLVG